MYPSDEYEARRLGEKYRRNSYLSYEEKEFVKRACRHETSYDLEREFREGAGLSPWERCDIDRR